MTTAAEQMALITQARKERRADLQEIMDANIGANVTGILAMNQARMAARLIDADPNATIEVPLEDVPAAGDAGFTEPTEE